MCLLCVTNPAGTSTREHWKLSVSLLSLPELLGVFEEGDMSGEGGVEYVIKSEDVCAEHLHATKDLL